MLRHAIIFLALFFSTPVFAVVSPDSAQLEILRLSLEKNSTPELEMKYLELFPSNYKNFRRIFMGNDESFDELADKTDEHLTLLETLSEKYPHKVLSIWFSVAINGSWDADAVGMVQHQLAQYAVSHTQVFVLALGAMPCEEKSNVIRFLADVENHYAYVEYPEIVKNLERFGYSELYKQFVEAKIIRMSQHDH